MTTTMRPVVRPRGELTKEQRSNIAWKKKGFLQAEQWYKDAVVMALREGASYRAVAAATGLSTATLQKWKKEASR